MKRLISWLLVLAMAIACLPMSAFAVEIDDTDPDVDVGFEELLPGYAADDRLLITFVMNETNTEGTASVTVPAGKTMYFEYMGDPTYELSVDGVAHVFVAATGRTDTNKFEIENNTDADKTYALKIALPVGTYNNPKVIEEMNWYSDEVTQTLGDYEGYYYIYTAAETGNVTLYFNAEYDDNGVIDCGDRDIKVTNLNTSSQYTLLEDGVDYYGLQLVVPVEAGQQLLINTSWAEDAEGNPFPAGTYSWTGNFSYPAGSVQNPITIEWEWNDTNTTATASVNVEADGTYYTGYAGMILTVDGVETEMSETGVFQLNAGEHALVMSTPVGASENPEVIEDINDYSDSNSLAADGNYNYIWTATEDGTVTLDVTDGANLTVDKLTYSEDSEWPISTQYVLAEPEIDENWNYTGWTVAENLVIDVVAGQQLKIQVNALTDWSTWTTPAIDYTLTGDFEAAVVEPVPYEVNIGTYTLYLDAELILQFKVFLPEELLNDANAYAQTTIAGNVTKISMADLLAAGTDSSGRYIIGQGIASGYMTKDVTLEIFDGNGVQANLLYKNEPVGKSWSACVKDYADLVFTNDHPSYVKVRPVVAALLTYGGYAQEWFIAQNAKIDADPIYNILAEYGASKLDVSTVNADMISQSAITSGADIGITYATASVYLESAVSIDVKFDLTSGNIDDYTFVVSYPSGDVTVDHEDITVDKNGRYVVRVYNVPAAYWDNMYTVTVTNNNTNEVYQVSYSVLCYCKSMMNYNAKIGNLLKAMYLYNEAANAYFNK